MAASRRRRAASTRRSPAGAARERGFSTLEAVITIPAVVIITMLVIQFVMLWHARNVTQAAAQRALQDARGYQASAEDGSTSARSYLHSAAEKMLENVDIDVRRGASTVTVTIHARVASVVPFGTFTVTESASGATEQWRSP